MCLCVCPLHTLARHSVSFPNGSVKSRVEVTSKVTFEVTDSSSQGKIRNTRFEFPGSHISRQRRLHGLEPREAPSRRAPCEERSRHTYALPDSKLPSFCGPHHRCTGSRAHQDTMPSPRAPWPALSVVLILLCGRPPAALLCPHPCACYVPSEVHCTFRSLASVPAGISDHVERINLGFVPPLPLRVWLWLSMRGCAFTTL